MIGAIPKNEEFDKLCDWPDAVIELPFGSEKVDGIVRELNRQPDRLREIRRNNVCQTLLRHDWAYRWEAILGHVGLEPLPGLLARKERLKSLAAAAMGEGGQYLADRAATIGRPQKWR